MNTNVNICFGLFRSRYGARSSLHSSLWSRNRVNNITQESLLSWRSPLRCAKFMLAGLIPHRNQWAKRKGGQQRLPSSRAIVIALDHLELNFLEKVKWETYSFQAKQIKVKDYTIFSVFKRFHMPRSILNTLYGFIRSVFFPCAPLVLL